MGSPAVPASPTNVWDVLGGLAQGAASFIIDKKNAKMQQKAMNQQVQIARYQAKAASAMPMLGMGYAATPLSGGSGFPGGVTMMPAMPTAQPINWVQDLGIGGPLGNMLAPRSGVTYSLTANGRVTGTRSLGTPLLWSGDLAAVRRVGRVARKLGRFVHRRPR